MVIPSLGGALLASEGCILGDRSWIGCGCSIPIVIITVVVVWGTNCRIEDHIEVRTISSPVSQLIFSEGLMEAAQKLAA